MSLFPIRPDEDVDVSSQEERQQATFGRSWRFDFDLGDFVTTSTGKIAQVEDVDALWEWCRKAIMTARYRYPVYSFAYGNEAHELIGMGLSEEAMKSELRRMYEDALIYDPRVASVEDFDIALQGDTAMISFKVTSVLGEILSFEQQRVEVY